MVKIYVEFKGENEKKLMKLKDESGLNWHDFILVSTGAIKRRDLWKKKVKED